MQALFEDFLIHKKQILINLCLLKISGYEIYERTVDLAKGYYPDISLLFSVVIIVIMCVPGESFFIEGNDNLGTLDVGLASWDEICFI